jgi:hypothetical protein
VDAPPTLLQLDAETFRVLLGDGVERIATLRHETRRGLGLHGVPPLAVASELVTLLCEHDALPHGAFDLGAAAGRVPGFVEEMAARLR